MEEKVIVNDSFREITKVKRVYYIFHDNFLSVEKVKRQEQWRINKLNLKPTVLPKVFNLDVTDWEWNESGGQSSNGPVFTKELRGFIPKLNEWAESYFNEMTRRPVTIFIETFNDTVYLFGGEKCRARFTYGKSISGRNGYDLSFTTSSTESSLVINDTDFFPAPPLVVGCAPVTINLDGTDILIAESGSTVTVNLEDTATNPVIPDSVVVVGNNVKLIFPLASSSYDLDLVDRFGNALPTKSVSANATWDLKTLTPYDFMDLYWNALTNPPSSTIIDDINDEVDNLIAAGIWQKAHNLNLLIGGNATDHAFNAKYPFANNTSGHLRFFGSPTHNANGISTNGTTQYIGTRNFRTFLPLNSAQVSIYIRNTPTIAASNLCLIGANSSPLCIELRITTGNNVNISFDDGRYGLGVVSMNRLLSLKRTASNNIEFSKDGSAPSSFGATVVQQIGSEIFIGAHDSVGTPINPCALDVAYIYVGEALSTSQETDHYTIMQAIQTILSRQI